MHLLPKSAELIEKALSGWRWSNYISGIMLGAIAGFFLVFPVFIPYSDLLFALIVPSVIGGIIGLQIARRYWRKLIERYRDSFIQLDDSALEIRASVRGGTRQVRCRLSEIESVELGRHRRIGAIHPLVAAVDSQSLVIKDRRGAEVAFEMIASTYRLDDLSALLSSLEARKSHENRAAHAS